MFPSRFIRSDAGAATVEFVVLIFAIVATVFFVLEVTLYLFFSATLHKAAQAGARAAVVSTPVAAGLPLCDPEYPELGFCNEKKPEDQFVYGQACARTGGACVAFTTAEYTGSPGECSAPDTDFCRIFFHMRGFSGQIEPDDVTIRYEWAGLGFAGGPIAPLVTVTVSNVPFQTGVVGLLLTNAGVLATLPTHTVSMTGEDLNRGGAP